MANIIDRWGIGERKLDPHSVVHFNRQKIK